MSKDNAIQVFSHPQFGSINTVETENGKVLFKGNDVQGHWGIQMPHKLSECIARGLLF